MRKRELIHFHALLARIRRFLDERGDLPGDAVESYEGLDVSPTEVYRPKRTHQDAVVTLTRSLASAVDAEGMGDAEGVGDADARSNAAEDDGSTDEVDDIPASARGD